MQTNLPEQREFPVSLNASGPANNTARFDAVSAVERAVSPNDSYLGNCHHGKLLSVNMETLDNCHLTALFKKCASINLLFKCSQRLSSGIAIWTIFLPSPFMRGEDKKLYFRTNHSCTLLTNSQSYGLFTDYELAAQTKLATHKAVRGWLLYYCRT